MIGKAGMLTGEETLMLFITIRTGSLYIFPELYAAQHLMQQACTVLEFSDGARSNGLLLHEPL